MRKDRTELGQFKEERIGTDDQIQYKRVGSKMEFKEFEPRFKSAKTRYKFSAGLNLKTFDTVFSGTNHT